MTDSQTAPRVRATGATPAQRQFNQYPKSRPALKLDIWRSLSKAEKRVEADRLVSEYLAKGGKITKCPPGPSNQAPQRVFDRRKRATSRREYVEYFTGNHGWTSTPDRSASLVRDDGAAYFFDSDRTDFAKAA